MTSFFFSELSEEEQIVHTQVVSVLNAKLNEDVGNKGQCGQFVGSLLSTALSMAYPRLPALGSACSLWQAEIEAAQSSLSVLPVKS